jgi:protein-tyrosine-phosphatase/DNA-binding transcriptional ArsR family regulator
MAAAGCDIDDASNQIDVSFTSMVAPPPFLRLAGHPLRWRLLNELAHSDRRVGELCELAGQRQSLVSYHLRQLREGELIAKRRSSADGRDSYYVLDLARCAELHANAGAALHPALAQTATAARRTATVLFLCTGNSARSQMAEAIAARHGLIAASAGSHPKPLHESAIHTMRRRGIEIAANRSKHLDEFTGRRFDYVISLCDRVREACPEFPGADAIHWSVPEPHDEEAFEDTARELETRIGFLVAAINATPQEVPEDV